MNVIDGPAVIRIVWPSEGARATKAVPIVPVAPGLLSTMTGLPNRVMFQQLLGLATVTVTTASAAGPVEIEGLDHEVAQQLGTKTTSIAWIALVAGLAGAAVQYGSQYWMNVIDYPINVGGRPLHSWPTFIPATLIVAILWAGLATLLGLLIILRLPRLHHPVFAVHGFERASQDRFFLCILSGDPLYDEPATRRFLETTAPDIVREVPGCG